MSLFSKFAFPFGFNKKNKCLPEGSIPLMSISKEDEMAPSYPVNTYKTIASFDIKLENPKYQGAIPDATIKFYPFN